MAYNSFQRSFLSSSTNLLTYLQDYSSRQHAVLESLYREHGKLTLNDKSDDFKPLDFIFNSELMTPLLTSYDVRKKELENDRRVVHAKREQLGKHIEEISEENKQCLETIERNAGGTELEGKVLDRKKEVANMERKIELYQRENQVLLQEVEELRNLIAHMGKEQKSLVENTELLPAMDKVKMRKVLGVARKKMRLVEEKRKRVQMELTVQKRKYLDLKDQMEGNQKELRLKEENKNAQLKRKELEENELRQSIKLQERDYEILQKERVTMIKHLEEKEVDCAAIQNSELESLGILKDETQKLKQVQFQIKAVQSLNEKRKQKIEEVVVAIQDSAKTFNEKCKRISEKVCAKYQRTIDRIQNGITKLESEIDDLKTKVDKERREKDKLQNDFERRLRQIGEEQKKPPKIVGDLTSKVSGLTAERDEIERKSRNLDEDFRKKQINYEREISKLTLEIRDSKNRINQTEQQICDCRITIENVTNKIETVKERNELYQKRIDDNEKKYKLELDNLRIDNQRKVRTLTNELNDKNLKIEELNAAISQMEEKIHELKIDKSFHKTEQNEKTIKELDEENNRMRLRNSELQSKYSTLLKERSSLSFTIEELGQNKRSLENQMKNAMERVKNSSTKIQELLDTETSLLQTKKSLAMEIERKTLEMERMKRVNSE